MHIQPMLLACRATAALVAGAAVALAVTGPTAASQTHTGASSHPTIEVGSNPSDLAWSRRNHTLYVLNDGSVSVVDTRTQTQTDEFKTGFQDQTAIALTGDQRLLVGTFDARALKLVDPTTRKIVGRARVGLGATGIATATPRRAERAFVSLLTRQQVAVVNPRTMKVVDRVRLPRGPQTIRTTRDQSQVWVGSSYSGRVWVIDTRSHTVIRRISVADAGPVSSIAFGPGGRRAWIAGLGGVQVVSTRTGAELGFLPADRLFPATDNLNIGEIALARGRAIVLNSTFPDAPARGTAAVIDTRTLRVTRHVRLGTEPLGLAVTPRMTYASNYQDDTVSYFRTPPRR